MRPYETGQILSSTLKREEIGSRLFEIMQRVWNLSAAVINLSDERRQLYVWHAVGPESLLHRACGAPAAQAARKAALETEESQLFQLQPSGPDTVPFVGLCLPLRARNQLIGVLEAYGLEDCTEKETVQSLESLVTQVASALENARLPRITTLYRRTTPASSGHARALRDGCSSATWMRTGRSARHRIGAVVAWNSTHEGDT